MQNCLAQPAEDFGSQCMISISLALLVAVIVCKVFKAVCLAGTLMVWIFHPRATVGDAVSMERPDRTTVACRPLSLVTVRRIFSKKDEPYSEKVKNWKGAYRCNGISRRRGYAICSGFCVGIFCL